MRSDSNAHELATTPLFAMFRQPGFKGRALNGVALAKYACIALLFEKQRGETEAL